MKNGPPLPRLVSAAGEVVGCVRGRRVRFVQAFAEALTQSEIPATISSSVPDKRKRFFSVAFCIIAGRKEASCAHSIYCFRIVFSLLLVFFLFFCEARSNFFWSHQTKESRKRKNTSGYKVQTFNWLCFFSLTHNETHCFVSEHLRNSIAQN